MAKPKNCGCRRWRTVLNPLISESQVISATNGANRKENPLEKPGLIVTRTPLRISFAGGGTDISDFYKQDYGAVLSTTINKYLYVTVKRHGDLFGEPVRINYSETELVQSIDDIKNAIARECLRLLDVKPPLYISTVADLPGSSGLGSSSSFAVGLLNALHAWRGERVSAGQLAQEASHIEINILKEPIGKQDQYIAAFGGLNHICFRADGRVTIEPQAISNGEISTLFEHMLFFWTGYVRDAGGVLQEQKQNTQNKMAELRIMRDHAEKLRTLIHHGIDLRAFGEILDESWRLKRQLASKITNSQIDQWYQKAISAGAYGGKLCGAGGGGVLLFIVPKTCHAAVRQSLSDISEISIGYESRGSRLLLPLAE